jgi:hypothetical protein
MPRPRFTPGERTPRTHWAGGCVGLSVGVDTEAKGKILSPLPGIEPWSPGRPARRQTLYPLSYPADTRLEHTAEITETPCTRDRHFEIGSSLRPYKATAVHTLHPIYAANRMSFWNLFLFQCMLLKVTLIWFPFVNETCSHLHEHVSFKNNRYCSSVSPHLIHQVSPHDKEVRVWFSGSAKTNCWAGNHTFWWGAWR